MAGLARRAGLHLLALKLLGPSVRGTGRKAVSASDEEKAEYAASLTYVGATEEALTLLKHVNSDRVPQALLFECFAHFAQWDYRAAIPLLTKYVASSKLDPYQVLVGKVNLAAALIQQKEYAEAQPLLAELRSATRGPGFAHLHGNVLELSAQNSIFTGDFATAAGHLRAARDSLEGAVGLSEFFVRKWEAFVFSAQNRGKAEAFTKLHVIRREAMSLHWETVRDCDRLEAVETKNESLLWHLYFGTPFEKFRERLLLDFGMPVEIAQTYLWRLNGEEGESSPSVLDVMTGEWNGRETGLKTGQVVHRLLQALTMDFYRPLRLAVAHHFLYPSEFFNPVSSVHQIHQALRRFRSYLRENDIPLDVEEQDNYYRLILTTPVALRVPHPGKSEDKFQRILSQLQSWGAPSFSATEASVQLRVPERTARRMLSELRDEGRLERAGAGPSTRYFLKEPPKKVSRD